jgi:hypothetical protein
LDFAAINAWIIYRGVTGEEMSRHAFLHQLSEERETWIYGFKTQRRRAVAGQKKSKQKASVSSRYV